MKHVKPYESINEIFGWGKKKTEPDTEKPESQESKPERNEKKGDELAQIIIDRVEKSYSLGDGITGKPIKIKDDGFRTYSVEIENDRYAFESDIHGDLFQIKVHGKKIEISKYLFLQFKKMYLEQEDREQDVALNKALDKLADYRKDAKKYNL